MNKLLLFCKGVKMEKYFIKKNEKTGRNQVFNSETNEKYLSVSGILEPINRYFFPEPAPAGALEHGIKLSEEIELYTNNILEYSTLSEKGKQIADLIEKELKKGNTAFAEFLVVNEWDKFYGYADVIIKDANGNVIEIWEVKAGSNWRPAIYQVSLYSLSFSDPKLKILFFEKGELKVKEIKFKPEVFELIKWATTAKEFYKDLLKNE